MAFSKSFTGESRRKHGAAAEAATRKEAAWEGRLTELVVCNAADVPATHKCQAVMRYAVLAPQD